MSVIKSTLKEIILFSIKVCSGNKLLLRLYNYVYEISPNRLLAKIEPLMPIPKFDFTWHINLGKQTAFFTYLKGEERIIYHFPLSYKKNDFGIRKLEEFLDTYYPKDISYFDIGANFGLRSIYYVSKGRFCYLFEPNLKCNVITERFMNENNYSNYLIVSKLVGERVEIKQFHLSKSTYLSSVEKSHSENYNDFLETIDIEQITIDDFITNNNLNRKIGIVKIDVEGYEYQVCLGAKNLLKQQNITLFIEVLEESITKEHLFIYLNNLGYKIFAVLHDYSKIRLQLMDNKFIDSTIDYLCTKDLSLSKKLNSFC